MKVSGIGHFSSIDEFVKKKIEAFEQGGKSFACLFELMFRERDNIMYESSAGYRIIRKTYGEIHDETVALACGLKTLLSPFEKNAVIGLYMDNGIEWIKAFWAILLCGMNPFLLNLRVHDDAVNEVLRISGARAVISSGKSFCVPTFSYSDIRPAKEAIPVWEFGTEISVMSSGTTQNIKICTYTAEELYYQICGSLGIIRKCPAMKAHFNGSLKLLTFLPFYHVFGFIAVYIWFAFFSRTFVGLSDLSPQTLLNTVKRHKVTHIFAVPLFWETVYKKALETIKGRGDAVYSKFRKGMRIATALHDIPFLGAAFSKAAFREVRSGLFGESIRFMISGGSTVSPDVLAFFNNIGYRLANGYGMTEIGITSVELSNRKKYLYSGYVGKPMPFCEYSLSDGELSVRGKICARYITEKGVRTENTGWFHTADLAEEKNGHYRILSRKDDIIITSSGENINPCLFEPYFRIDGINGACMVKSEEKNGVVPTLILSVDKRIGAEAFSALRTEIVKISEKVRFPLDGKIFYTTDPLLLPNEFKPNRLRIAADYRAHAFTPAESDRAFTREDDAERDETTREICRIIARQLNRADDSIRSDSDFFTDMGMTSLEYFAVLSEINAAFSLNILPDADAAFRTVRQISDYMKEH